MARLLLLNKPFHVLSQFTDQENRPTLSSILNKPDHKGLYPAGRLDFDSEGLILLTDCGELQNRITQPQFKLPKTYWVQIEGRPSPEAIEQLCKGVDLKDGKTRPAKCALLPAPNLWERTPPIRQRKNQPTSWIELTIHEGKNRQVRRMTAAIGHPTLRLVRVKIGSWGINDLPPAHWRWENISLPKSTKKKPNDQKKLRKTH